MSRLEPNRSSCSRRKAKSKTPSDCNAKRGRRLSTPDARLGPPSRSERNGTRSTAKSRAVLSSQPLVPGGAEQLTQLWRSQFIVEPQGDSFNVRTPTFQSVGDYVSAQLARPEYAHFIRASNPGGGTAGTTGGHRAAPTSPANQAAPVAPKNFGEAIILQMQESQKNQPTDPRLNPAVAMGLNARSMVRQA